MRARLLSILAVSVILSGFVFAQRTASHFILNPTSGSGQYSFEIWSQRTNVSGSLLVGITSYYFDLNQAGFNFGTTPVLSNINSKYTGVLGVDDYDPMTAQYVNLSGTYKLAITINFTGNNTGAGSPLVTTAPNGERMCTVTLAVANAAQTANLTWDLNNAAMTTSNLQPNTDTFIGSDNSPLPVEMSSFTATTSRLSATLDWSTATEVNSMQFDVERKAALGTSSWTKIGSVAAAGNSSVKRDYSYTDNSVSAGDYQYRINTINKDGSSKYSPVVDVMVGQVAKVFNLGSNYPNPFNPSTKLEFSLEKDGRASLKVYNIIGEEVATLFDGDAKAGLLYQESFDASRLTSGIYFARLQSGGKQQMKKMVLMK